MDFGGLNGLIDNVLVYKSGRPFSLQVFFCSQASSFEDSAVDVKNKKSILNCCVSPIRKIKYSNFE